MYAAGDQVRVKRTAGHIEEGWWVLTVHCGPFTAPEACPVTVLRFRDPDHSMRNLLDGETVPVSYKTVTMLDLIHWNKLGAAG